MEKIITYENLRNFAYSNDKLCAQPIRGIVLNFIGLGNTQMLSDRDCVMQPYADRGIVFVQPYLNPWAWMNRQAVSYTDELVDVLFAHYGLDENTPVVASGGSMGGQQALVYTVYAKRTPVACVANCPVCDLPYHCTERPDLPRTMYSAFGTYDMPFQQALESASPLHLADKLPHIKYFLFHCENDKAVSKARHSDMLVAKIGNSRELVYHTVPNRGHCDLTPPMADLYFRYTVESICG